MILNIYKPKNISSFGVVSQIRRRLNIKKVGHAGTLDPLAEGVLVILTDQDTKKQDSILHTDKEYVATVGFGVFSETYDLEKVPELRQIPALSILERDVPVAIAKFIGVIKQQVPVYSAVKVGGVPLYKKARKGKSVDAQSTPIKKVTINSIEIMNYGMRTLETSEGAAAIPFVELKVTCSHGTYIRALARDLGDVIGYSGTLLGLVRTRIGDFTVDKAVKVEDLKL
ncbi:tRNA pseudouridine(55) synthase TruB [candidate division WWE3 bacterium RIFOXYC1_FULL_39_7]|uniref:tRNA pseudouridine(55) synthase n=2 Tax=Katanobacteria TaxID=422282 RepID=A0A1F4X9A4_UNCKA|nr:MAG: tRNA pseudouridine(55) synthase TruB [candidate division WWE3 bacterium RIFOXYC1_FULL_39_7]OGC78111.1 MAG: tRNA pseudouridine(55) synthase TruB [candidate division WWE3 bacterium RIFOXYD1_FULL_39_9]